ncbi:MAG: PilZ domain-containing protein [Spirochaetia bacterium]|jgi:hypothetical protein|nr:PilZ domain-containing protein [Spirochaetia bacterium]
MLFKRLTKTSQVSSGENSRAPRYASLARISINGFEGEAVLRNVSIGGFRMESKTYAAITGGERYAIRIKPETASRLSAFELEVEARWVKSTEASFTSGFLVTKPPTDRSLEKYIDYIKIKGSSSHPDRN